MRGRVAMEYKGVKYTVIQLTEGAGWRWEVELGEGKSRSGVTRASREVAIKFAEHAIDHVLKEGK
jgi:hypothetical protein